VVVATLEELEAELGEECPEATLQHVTDFVEFVKYGLMFGERSGASTTSGLKRRVDAD